MDKVFCLADVYEISIYAHSNLQDSDKMDMVLIHFYVVGSVLQNWEQIK